MYVNILQTQIKLIKRILYIWLVSLSIFLRCLLKCHSLTNRLLNRLQRFVEKSGFSITSFLQIFIRWGCFVQKPWQKRDIRWFVYSCLLFYCINSLHLHNTARVSIQTYVFSLCSLWCYAEPYGNRNHVDRKVTK